jgi:hypothetical protein
MNKLMIVDNPASIMANACTAAETELVEETLQRIARDVAMISDREFVILSVESARAVKRAVGKGQIHISFKLSFHSPDHLRYGCLLVPLPDAISVAGYLMMVPDEAVKAKRSGQKLDGSMKDAMLEVCNFVGGATDAALRALGHKSVRVSAAGCQGVKPDLRPAFPYHEGDALLVGRAKAKMHDFAEFELILMVPELPAPPAV